MFTENREKVELWDGVGINKDCPVKQWIKVRSSQFREYLLRHLSKKVLL